MNIGQLETRAGVNCDVVIAARALLDNWIALADAARRVSRAKRYSENVAFAEEIYLNSRVFKCD